MGQYFRKWLEKEKLITKNYQPLNDEIRFYSNSMQRTIATAKFFSAGLFPVANTNIEYHMNLNTMDPVFTPQFTFMNDEYKEAAIKEINNLFSDKIKSLEENYKLLEKVIDLKDSKDYKESKITEFKADDTIYDFKNFNEPKMSGSLKLACSVSDALVLQYYEEKDEYKAAFNHNLSYNDWEKIAKIKDVYGDVLFTAPSVAYNVSNPLLREINNELENDNRKFSFLCGHDSNIGSVLKALDVLDYNLPKAIEKTTPIGSKVVFSLWNDDKDNSYVSLNLVYQTVEQLRNISILDLDNNPGIINLKLKNINQNRDGLYEYNDIITRFNESILQYDLLKQKYHIYD